MSLESIIRPFETPQALSRNRTAAVVASGDAPGPAALCWGVSGAVPDGSPIGDVDPYEDISWSSECCKDTYTQKARETETKRIDASDGSGFFVEFKRPKLLDFFKENNACSSQASRETVVIAPIANFFTPDGQPIYGITDNRAKHDCGSTFRYDYGDEPPAPAP